MHRLGLLLLLSVAESTASAAANEQDIWTFSRDPLVQIGQEGVPEKEFARVMGVALLPSGNVVVANGASQELRVFTAAGQYVKSLSRNGDGPGELRLITWVSREADTLFVWDGILTGGRLHAFTERDGFLSRMQPRARSARVSAVGRLSNGSLLVVPGSARGINPRLGELIRDSLRLGLLVVNDSADVHWLGQFPGVTFFAYPLPNVAARVGLARYSYGPQPVYAVSEERVWIGDSGRNEITVYDAWGSRVAVLRVPGMPRRFDRAAIARVKARELAAASNDDELARIEAHHGAGIRPRIAPFFSRFVPGTGGEMWVELYREDPARLSRFVVFSATGKHIASASGPASVRFFEVTRDRAAGVVTDENGVERVVVYALSRGSGSGSGSGIGIGSGSGSGGGGAGGGASRSVRLAAQSKQSLRSREQRMNSGTR
jgi:hypothetical protein